MIARDAVVRITPTAGRPGLAELKAANSELAMM